MWFPAMTFSQRIIGMLRGIPSRVRSFEDEPRANERLFRSCARTVRKRSQFSLLASRKALVNSRKIRKRENLRLLQVFLGKPQPAAPYFLQRAAHALGAGNTADL
jgi:hypothetical protein